MSAHHTAGQRRAMNQVWNGAGVYGFEPLFLSLNGDGSPNLYLNTIVGCVRKWYGEEGPARLFQAWAGDRRQALLDDLAWLALESAAYQLELPQRPILADLRRDWAAEFFDKEHTLSRQEWMAKNQLSYTMQSARWRAVLGKRPPVMTPYERRLHLTGKWAGVMTRLMPTEIVHTDVASVGHGKGSDEGDSTKLDIRRASIRLKEDISSDRLYIQSCFGPSLLPQRELAAAEQKLCAGLHLGCHLWYTAGVPTPEQASGGEARRLAEQARLQQEHNREAFSADAALYQNTIRRLTEQIQNCIRVHSQAEEETARSGKLNTPRVWRAAALSDRRVFVRETDSARPGFSVDLLLDASSSRMHCQEAVAAQGYILAESLARCGVPVRVSGFCSLRGYTVLRVLKDFGDSSGQVFRYFAAGWNRDGLVLRAAGELLEVPPEQRRLFLLLTDASPNDSRRIPPGGDYPFGRDYADAPAVEDAAREVRALERQGCHVGAIFMGPSLNIPSAETIYGKSLARIHTLDQLASAAGRLIQAEIQELE